MRKLMMLSLGIAMAVLTGCTDDENDGKACGCQDLFVVNNGLYGTGNASISVINAENGTVQNNVVAGANNGLRIGDGAQSMTVVGDEGWICVTNSNVVYAIDTDDYEVEHTISDISNPRYFKEISKTKAYVSHLYENYISVVDLRTKTVTDKIQIPDQQPGTGSTEQMVKVGNFVYTNCWSYQRTIAKINTNTDRVVDMLEVGIQPQSIYYNAADRSLWVLCDGGGWDGNPIGYEQPSMVKVDLEKFEKVAVLQLNAYSVSALTGSGEYMYWLQDNQVVRMNAKTMEMNVAVAGPFGYAYALYVDPKAGDIYVADAGDFMSAGKVYHYCSKGNLLEEYEVGYCPIGFAAK